MRVSVQAVAHAMATLLDEHGIDTCDKNGCPVSTIVTASLLAYYINGWYNVRSTTLDIDPILSDQAHDILWP